MLPSCLPVLTCLSYCDNARGMFVILYIYIHIYDKLFFLYSSFLQQSQIYLQLFLSTLTYKRNASISLFPTFRFSLSLSLSQAHTNTDAQLKLMIDCTLNRFNSIRLLSLEQFQGSGCSTIWLAGLFVGWLVSWLC